MAVLLAEPAAARNHPGDDQARAAFLREEIRLARSGEAYLVLDAASGRLSLRRRHVELIHFATRAQVGIPRWAGSGPLTWPDDAFVLQSELREPRRPRLEPPSADRADTNSVAPYTVEYLEAGRERWLRGLPARYRLSFAPHLDVVVVGESSPRSFADRWRAGERRIAEAWRGLIARIGGRPARVRLLLITSPAEARRLYLSLEPGMELLVAPPRAVTAGPFAIERDVIERVVR